jgi:hypothetical protein
MKESQWSILDVKYSPGFGSEGNTTRKAFRKLHNFIREAPESKKD